MIYIIFIISLIMAFISIIISKNNEINKKDKINELLNDVIYYKNDEIKCLNIIINNNKFKLNDIISINNKELHHLRKTIYYKNKEINDLKDIIANQK